VDGPRPHLADGAPARGHPHRGRAVADREGDTLEKTADYKSRIFLGLEPGGVAVIGAHIPCLVQVVKAAMRTAAKVWTVGTGPDANVRLLEAQPEPEGCRVRIAIRGRTHEYLFPIASAGLVRNSALAFTAMVAMGFDAEEPPARACRACGCRPR
jgi:UDP-N-acetylmuramyl pentapeptide synthase